MTMIKTFLMMVASLMMLAGCTQTLTQEHYDVLAKTCETGETFYSYILAAASVEAISTDLKGKSDSAYGILKPICDKGSTATQADIVLAGAQVYVLTKAWRDAT